MTVQSEWQPIESAPKDGTRILCLGHWNERAAKHCQGQEHRCVGAWSSFMSDGVSGYHWIYEGSLGNMRPGCIAVTFTKWMPLPEPPK